MRIDGRCHCGNIRYVLDWPDDEIRIMVRACGCGFCVKHGGSWTSHREAELRAEIHDPSRVSKYRFGTRTADFYVCSHCGAVPFVTSLIDDCLYAVVNVNTFEEIDTSSLDRTPTSFDGEGSDERLERRKRNWIREVRITGA